MSNTKRKTVSFKLDEDKAETVKEIISDQSSRTGKDQGDILYSIVLDSQKPEQRSENHAPETTSSQVLETINCPYLEIMDSQFTCLEGIAKKKKVETIGYSPEETLIKCRACIRYKLEARERERQKELRTEAMRKLAKFVAQFSKIASNGFEVVANLCTCNEFEGNQFIFSRDGETLFCPLQDDDLVNIKAHCQQKINPNTGEKPCEYLIALSQIVNLDAEFWDGVETQYPDLTLENDTLNKLLPEPEPEILQGKRVVNVEATFIEKESEPEPDSEPDLETELDLSLTQDELDEINKKAREEKTK